MVFGAYKGKSKNSANSEQFSKSRLYLYSNPVKNTCTLKDSVLIEAYENIRTDIKRIFCASAACEIIDRTFAAGGEYKNLFRLADDVLKSLDSGKDHEYVLVQFLLRFLKISGSPLNMEECCICGKSMENARPAYSFSRRDFVCPECLNGEFLEISDGTMKYINYTKERSFADSLSVSLDSAGRENLKKVLSLHISEMSGSAINSLGGGVI